MKAVILRLCDGGGSGDQDSHREADLLHRFRNVMWLITCELYTRKAFALSHNSNIGNLRSCGILILAKGAGGVEAHDTEARDGASDGGDGEKEKRAAQKRQRIEGRNAKQQTAG